MCYYIAVWNVKYYFLLKKLNSWNDQLGHYASLTYDSETDFTYFSPDDIEIEFLSKEYY